MASQGFINECKKFAYMNRFGEIYIDGYETVLNQSNMIQDFTVDSGCYVNGEIIGSAYSKKLEAHFINALDVPFASQDLWASVLVSYVEEDVTHEEYCALGQFVIERPEDEQTANLSTLIAYDYLLGLSKPYTTELDYENDTITIADVYEELCTNLNLTPITTVFTNSTITVENNPFTNGENNRVVLESIAKVACAFVDIDYDNYIDLKWLSQNVDYEFERSDYSTLEGTRIEYGPINNLVLANSMVESENVSISDAASIELNGEHSIVIKEDYFLYDQSKKQDAINAIWAKVHNLTYVDCTLTTYTGKPFLNIGDKIRIYLDDEKTQYFDTYVLSHQFTFDGTFKSIIKSPALSNVEIAVKQDISLAEKLRQTEILVNKQEGIIQENVSKTNEIDTRVNNNYQEIIDKFNGYAPKNSVVELQTSVNQLQTDTYSKTEVNTMLIDGSVKKLQTTSATFDENGMTYRKTNSEVETTINEVGVNTKKIANDKTILFAGYVDENNSEFSDYQGQTIVATDNIIVDKYLVVGSHSRFEDYETGTGCFYIG